MAINVSSSYQTQKRFIILVPLEVQLFWSGNHPKSIFSTHSRTQLVNCLSEDKISQYKSYKNTEHNNLQLTVQSFKISSQLLTHHISETSFI